MTISVIIPLYKATELLQDVLHHLRSNAVTKSICEIIVCEFATLSKEPQHLGPGVSVVHCLKKGRALQLNQGVAESKGDVLYFLHADSFPPCGFDQLILDAVKKDQLAGCFRIRFDHDHWFLSLSAWFSRFGGYIFHGGDQSLFITRKLYNKTGGYNTALDIMEDYDFVKRLKKIGQFAVLKYPIVTSSKKYLIHGIIKLQLIYGYIHLLYAMKIDQDKLLRTYNKFVK